MYLSVIKFAAGRDNMFNWGLFLPDYGKLVLNISIHIISYIVLHNRLNRALVN